ncbi:MAG: hypothetical protein ACUVX8_13120, partial [Candidatus Zipacnadales bacterium]
SDIGLYGDPEWVNKPKAIPRAATEIPRPAPPAPIFDDFENTPVGEQPLMARISGEEADKGASIRVTDETASTGKHSLKFTDAPGLAQVWQPHMYYLPDFRRGLIHCAFDVRIEPGAIFWHEWRDRANPYHAGPSVRIEANGELRAGGQTLLTVPHGQWLHMDIDCGLGKEAGETYQLAVTLPNGEEHVFEVPLANAEFRRLQWLGFISLAEKTTAFYIDNVQLLPIT